jgi:hypothetical protein
MCGLSEPLDLSFRYKETLKRLKGEGLFRIYLPLGNANYLLIIKTKNI